MPRTVEKDWDFMEHPVIARLTADPFCFFVLIGAAAAGFQLTGAEHRRSNTISSRHQRRFGAVQETEQQLPLLFAQVLFQF